MSDAWQLAARDAVIKAVKSFDFENYGLEDVNPHATSADWVPDLAACVIEMIVDLELERNGDPVGDKGLVGLLRGLMHGADQHTNAEATLYTNGPEENMHGYRITMVTI